VDSFFQSGDLKAEEVQYLQVLGKTASGLRGQMRESSIQPGTAPLGE
jgi:hypothetical protein